MEFKDLSDNVKAQIRFRIWCGLLEEICSGNCLLDNEIEEMINWYESNYLIGTADLKKAYKDKKVNKF